MLVIIVPMIMRHMHSIEHCYGKLALSFIKFLEKLKGKQQIIDYVHVYI